MSTVITNTSVFTNRSFPFDKIHLSPLEKRNRKYYIDYSVEETPIFLQINKVKLLSEPIFIDDEQGYVDIEIQDRIEELGTFFRELDNFNQLICFKHSEDWLGKSLDMDNIEKVYKSSYKDKVIRLKIERETIKMYDMKKNKLNIDSDLKIGDCLDVIMEISGLKLMKSAFSTYIILRQIRKHPEPVSKKKNIPNEYLFLDEYSNRNKASIHDDNSLDDQTDIDVLVNKNSNKSRKVPINELMANYSKKETKQKSIEDILDLKDPGSSIEGEETKAYINNINNTMNEEIDDSSASKNKIQSASNRKDQILDALENGEIGLDSIISSKSIKIPKKKTNPKKTISKFTDEELHKDI